ncbi:hypothetical protein SBA4_4590021 [Candidatus Sulfopaludibacter sp. SbA4]|nr:hypothetical protein SBA4_4590021 [Candidatus Sulfopaludibacter sp. SbA4]
MVFQNAVPGARKDAFSVGSLADPGATYRLISGHHECSVENSFSKQDFGTSSWSLGIVHLWMSRSPEHARSAKATTS